MKKTSSFLSVSKRILVASLLAVIMAFSFVGETGAWLVHTSGVDSTTMTKGGVDIAINGSGSPANAYVTNNGNVPVYVRVAVAVNWINNDASNWLNGDGSRSKTRQVLAKGGQGPQKGAQNTTYKNDDGTTSKVDYNYTVRTADWLEANVTENMGSSSISYTILYYRKPLAPGASTSTMFSAFNAWNGKTKTYYVHSKNLTFTLTTDFLADAIQCETSGRLDSTAKTAAVQEWGVTLSAVGGNITAGPTGDTIPYLQ